MKKSSKRMPSDPNVYPRGWTRKQIDDLRRHYDNQTEDEAAAEIEAAFNDSSETLMIVPSELVPEIDRLLAAHSASKKRPGAHHKTPGRAARKAGRRRAHAA